MKRLKIPFLLAAMLSITPGIVAADTVLTLQAIEATAQIESRNEDRPHTRLPTLELSLRASIACPADTKAESLTVSVSDTHRRYGAEELANTISLEAFLRVPADQLAPISAPDFCIDDAPIDEFGLLLPGVATAQVSLHCHSESERSSVHFASVALPLRLYCLADGDQDSSTVR